MKRFIFILLLFTLILAPLTKLYSQDTTVQEDTVSFDRSTVPQWAKDIRRFDIISFGIFPFAVMLTNMTYEPLIRDSIELTSSKHSNILLLSAGISLTLATVDIIITAVKRNNEKRKLENIPIGSYEIEVVPYKESSDQQITVKEEFDLKQTQIKEKLLELQETE